MTFSALNVAQAIIRRYAENIFLTNLTLNIFLYYSQVESIRRCGHPLFDDPIFGWEAGPVVFSVYAEFREYGHERILKSTDGLYSADDIQLSQIIDHVMEKYGWMTVFDLLEFVQRARSGWAMSKTNSEIWSIDSEDIITSDDVKDYPRYRGSIKEFIDCNKNKWESALTRFGSY
ncbi:DUF4065 domain-containing protein [Alloscardovia theropitheci]|uniref:DUF4065 domain-containing protein n=1 Tax=Alloscardovia theropitheci TaxID=2496842 RepID=A0A4R0R0J5_9BIFI|nr:type II toxin-antitoxin system antitoxin SocA domain-containing protein [Alloscardovia theropitheci]TCD54566.1 DUF4065 domain-containing protein [Alloscardovia theropitheci]